MKTIYRTYSSCIIRSLNVRDIFSRAGLLWAILQNQQLASDLKGTEKLMKESWDYKISEMEIFILQMRKQPENCSLPHKHARRSL